jgi:hypothetical protein
MIARFQSVCDELDRLIEQWGPALLSLPEGIHNGRRNDQDRTIKQIVGHMVDSASNNTHRIIHLQYRTSPVDYPDYANLGNNDRWIAIQNYREEPWDLLVQLWISVNRHFVHVVRQVDPEKIGQVWISALGDAVTLEAMIVDFPRHFKLHLSEIEELI